MIGIIGFKKSVKKKSNTNLKNAKDKSRIKKIPAV